MPSRKAARSDRYPSDYGERVIGRKPSASAIKTRVGRRVTLDRDVRATAKATAEAAVRARGVRGRIASK